MTTLFLDLETYSPAPLKLTGVYPYAEHPETEILIFAYSWDGAPAQYVLGTQETIKQFGDVLQDPSVLKVAHNSNFDRVVLSAALGMPTGQYLDPNQWDDTMALAAERGLPLPLGELTKELKTTPKDSAGTRLINLFSQPDRHGVRTYAEEQPEDWAKFLDYALQDVDSMVEVWDLLPGWPTAQEREIWVTDQLINDYGIQTDTEFARWAVEQDEKNRENFHAQLRQLLGIENAGSVVQVKDGLSRLGLDVPNLRADTLDELLEDPELTADQRRAIELRKESSLVAARKYSAIIHYTCSDGRARGGFRFYGAHTGRWSGRGIQLQNLPRAQIRVPETALLDAQLGLDADPWTLKASVRSTLVGPFVVSDYAAIEARVLAWLADERWALDAFASGRDIYVETAERMGGLTRQQGKVAVLALGYQGGENSLRHMGAQGTDEDLRRMKVQWRRANPRIVSFWKDFESVFMDGGSVGRIRVEIDGSTRLVYLPSGRPLAYRRVRKEPWYMKTDEGETIRKFGIRFTNSRGRSDTYGGRLTENVVQAVSRDVLGDLLVRLAGQGLSVAGHVHDEVIVDAGGVQDSQALRQQVEDMMSSGPEWAEGLPLSAESFYTERYMKG